MEIRHLKPTDWDAVSILIHAALSSYYVKHLNDPKFGTDPTPFRLIPELYEALDPSCCLVAVDPANRTLTGCVFYHPRDTHIGIGIVATHPEASGRGVAKILMQQVLQMARDAGLPARLVSSAMNLHSFSLYTRLGFVPYQTFQDVMLTVPEIGLNRPDAPRNTVTLRRATAEDVPRIVDLENHLNGVRRPRDYHHFVENTPAHWHLLVAESADGALRGFLAGVDHPGMAMLGPGVADCPHVMAELVHELLDTSYRGKTVVWLVPVDATSLVQQAYSWGARNVELHIASACGPISKPTGTTLPTFMPESG
jgi:GNAT superfamily N-acetyltransferase